MASILSHKMWTAGVLTRVKNNCVQLTNRYGPRYTSAMLGAAFVGLFLPVPGSMLLCAGAVASVAEVHRAIIGSARVPRAMIPDSNSHTARPWIVMQERRNQNQSEQQS
ncbi:MAG: hypothetical protein JW959_15135 [Pirellulales bacterium]|nr:hypothetical protein [Pirellulales bacterium]